MSSNLAVLQYFKKCDTVVCYMYKTFFKLKLKGGSTVQELMECIKKVRHIIQIYLNNVVFMFSDCECKYIKIINNMCNLLTSTEGPEVCVVVCYLSLPA